MELSSNSQRVGNAVHVVEPAGNESDLEDGTVVETVIPQLPQVVGCDFVGVAGELGGEIEHGAIGGRKIDLRVVPPQRGGEFVVKAGSTQELGVAFPSVEALIEDRNDGGDHLVLSARQG